IRIKSYQTKTVLVRVVQEFIQNSLKHANCETIKVSMQMKEEDIVLDISDDGKGFDINKKVSGIGLKNIKKRVELIRGQVELKSELNIGTKLRIKIPKE
ncbi:MAG: sensor histidine kinase, partial [Flavobacteriales bacterium]